MKFITIQLESFLIFGRIKGDLIMKNIVLITIDTLRQDHCSCYGYNRKTTPFIDNLAHSGVRFNYAFANGPLTPRSFPSILGGEHIFKGKKEDIKSYHLPKNIETIAQRLERKGYLTVAFQAGNPFVSKFYGYDRGFEFFKDFVSEQKYKDIEKTNETNDEDLAGKISKFLDFLPPVKKIASEIYEKYQEKQEESKLVKKINNNNLPFIRGGKLNEEFSEWLDNYDISKPIFLWIHYMDVHQPHVPKEKICKELNLPVYSKSKIAKHWREIDSHEIKSKQQVKELKNLYDCEIRYVDYCIRKLFKTLSKNGIEKDNTLFVLTSDHGEEFGEHGGLGHEMKLYNEMLLVPLILYGQGSQDYISESSSLLELKSIPSIITSFSEGEVSNIGRDYVISQSLKKEEEEWSRLVAVQNRRYKLISEKNSSVKDEFYDLQKDSMEKQNLIDNKAYSEEIKKFKEILEEFLIKDSKEKKLRNETKKIIKNLKQKKKI